MIIKIKYCNFVPVNREIFSPHFPIMKKIVFTFLVLAGTFSSLMAQKELADVIVTTDSGKIYLRLFDDTPKHKANFLKLAGEGFYDGIAFHRIIKNFMIQGGNPNFRQPNPSTSDGPGYMLDAEISPKYVHTKGMLAAARMGDNVNPERKSSGSQFYIVTGNAVSNEMLTNNEGQIANAMMQGAAGKLQAEFGQIPENAAMIVKYQTAVQNKDSALARATITELNAKFSGYVQEKTKDMPQFKYTQAQRDAYAQLGGAPWLDMQYTVFGQVVEGMDVVDKLGKVATKPGDVPVQDVRIVKVEIVKK